MTMPNFLIIGAGRSGTTSLYDYLRQHPQVYTSPIKEPRFFAYEGERPTFRGPGDQSKMPQITNLTDYEALFAGVTREKAIGEASPIYLYSQKAPERIRHYLPRVKLIAILRHPVERAYSRFWANRVRGIEPLSDFAQAMQAEEMRIRDNWHPHWHYKQRGFYYRQLERYLSLFDRNQVQVYLSQDLVTNPSDLMRDMYVFLGIDETFQVDASQRRHQARRIPKNKVPHTFLARLNPIRASVRPLLPTRLRRRFAARVKTLTTTPRPPLAPELRATLTAEYRQDILRLQELIQRDLSEWLR